MRIGFASTSNLAIPFIKAFQADGHEIVSLISREAKRSGRGLNRKNLKIDEFANAHGIRVFHPEETNTLYDHLIETQPDMVFVISYGSLIDKKLLEIPKYGWVNLHFSLLPAYRGAAPVQRAILEGEANSGITFFKLDQGMDTGPIYLAREFPINQDETTSEVLNRLSIEGSTMTLAVLEMIKEFKQPVGQSIEGACFAPKFQKKDGEINWEGSSESIYNLYRALGFNPGIWSVLNGVRIRINNLRRSDVLSDLRPGDINVVNEKMYVGTSDGIIEILELTPAGRNSMTGAEFVRGLTSKVGLHFG